MWKELGKLAVKAGGAYLGNRDAEGMKKDLQTVKSIGLKISAAFNGADAPDSYADAPDIYEEVLKLLEEHLFDDAESIVNDYWNQYFNGKEDFYYNHIRAYISLRYYEQLDYDSELLPNIESEIRGYISKCRKFASDKDERRMAADLADGLEREMALNTDLAEFKERLTEMCSEFDAALDDSNPQKAQEILDAYYDGSEKDYWYYKKYMRILTTRYWESFCAEQRLSELQQIYSEMQASAANMNKLKPEDSEVDEEHDELIGWTDFVKDECEIERCKYLTINGLYDEAVANANAQLIDKKELYYGVMSSIESRRMAEAVEKKTQDKQLLEQMIATSTKYLTLAMSYNDGRNNDLDEQRIAAAREYLQLIGAQYIVTTKETFTDVENEYRAEIIACLADDGSISDRERRLLDKLRKSLGISEERAKELEQSCDNTALTKEEQEYADEIKACLAEDNEISDKERRLLNRLYKSLNISDERAREIEQMIIK